MEVIRGPDKRSFSGTVMIKTLLETTLLKNVFINGYKEIEETCRSRVKKSLFVF